MLTLTHNQRRVTHHTLSGNFQSSSPARFVQLSDLHIYENTCPNYWQHLLHDLSLLTPDAIFLTGDYIHKGPHYVAAFEDWAKKIAAIAPTFACMGNHDYEDYHHGEKTKHALHNAGITLLINQNQILTTPGGFTLQLIGMDDHYCGRPNIAEGFKNCNPELPTLVMAHNPLLADRIIEECPFAPNWVLSGHTHAGHVYIPWLKQVYLKVFRHKYRYGWYTVDSDDKTRSTQLYVTSGIGGAAFYIKLGRFTQALPRFRYNTHPEIVVFDVPTADMH